MFTDHLLDRKTTAISLKTASLNIDRSATYFKSIKLKSHRVFSHCTPQHLKEIKMALFQLEKGILAEMDNRKFVAVYQKKILGLIKTRLTNEKVKDVSSDIAKIDETRNFVKCAISHVRNVIDDLSAKRNFLSKNRIDSSNFRELCSFMSKNELTDNIDITEKYRDRKLKEFKREKAIMVFLKTLPSIIKNRFITNDVNRFSLKINSLDKKIRDVKIRCMKLKNILTESLIKLNKSPKLKSINVFFEDENSAPTPSLLTIPEDVDI